MALPILLEPDIILELSVLLNFSNMSMSDKDTPDGKVKRAKNQVYRGCRCATSALGLFLSRQCGFGGFLDAP